MLPILRACSKSRLAPACVLASLLLAATPATSFGGWSHNPAAQVPICTAPGEQQWATSCPDGVGGALFVWEDHRDSVVTRADIYAQRISADGVIPAGWPVNGVAVCTASGDQTLPTIATDGASGAYVTWLDGRAPGMQVYAQHVLAGGIADPVWPTNGLVVCGAANLKRHAQIIADGSGGAIICWNDDRDSLTSGWDLFAQHVLSGGTVDAAWPVDGRAICKANNLQSSMSMVTDGAGGALLDWMDRRNPVISDYDIYTSHLRANGTIDPAVPTNGTVVCNATGPQDFPLVATDGAGGEYVAWQDYRSSSTDGRIYMHHVLGNGTVDPAWPANGLVVCNVANSNQQIPLVVADATGGAIAVWFDSRAQGQTYAEHVLANGTVDPAWPATGVALSNASVQQALEWAIPDGSGGVIASWQYYPDPINTPPLEYVSHLLSSGVPDPAWPPAGVPLSTAPGAQQYSYLVTDGAGGAIASWQNGQSLVPYQDDIYAGRVSFNGLLAPEPVITSVRDVPADQGGHVVVRWNASWLDTLPTRPIATYDLWRRLTGTAAQRAISPGAGPIASGVGARAPGALRVTREAGTAVYWEYIISVPARGFSGYAYTADTPSDSVAAGIPWSDFMVDAVSAAGSAFYTSAVDSGYSVDNLPPAVPAPFTGAYSAGATILHWGAVIAPDLAGYRLYRGSSAGFVPGSGNLVVAQTSTDYTDVGPAGSWYKLSAVDVHGNESAYAVLAPNGTLDVRHGGAVALALEGAWPNPAVGTGLSIAFTLPGSAPARLELLDVSGRTAAVRDVGILGAGRHTLDVAAGRALPPGLYLARLACAGEVRTNRVVVLR